MTTATAPKVVEPQSLLNSWLNTPWMQAKAQVTQLFGPTSFSLEPPGYGFAHWHDGIDIAGMASGTNLLSGVEGTVESIGNDPHGFGHFLIIRPTSDPTKEILFGHLKDTNGNQGKPLKAGYGVHVGDILGHINSTGNSTGTHLHFSVYDNTNGHVPIDPIDWLVGPGSFKGPIAADQSAQKTGDIQSNAAEDFFDALFFPGSPGSNRWGKGIATTGKRITFTGVGIVMMIIGVVLYFRPHAPSELNNLSKSTYATVNRIYS